MEAVIGLIGFVLSIMLIANAFSIGTSLKRIAKALEEINRKMHP